MILAAVLLVVPFAKVTFFNSHHLYTILTPLLHKQIIYGAVTSYYFHNAVLGGWWGGAACVIMCGVAQLTLLNS